MTTLIPQRLLVVEDEPEILSEVAGYLRRRGETVVTAASFEEAMGALNDGAAPIDMLITDARLPDGNGVDLLRCAIARQGGPAGCILMTGHLEESDVADVLEQSGVVVVFKPFSLAAFYREVLAVRTAHCQATAMSGLATAQGAGSD